jgi:signal transduction histidine kinase
MEIQGPVTDDQRMSLSRIKANQEHLLALITEILDFARLETGRTTYHSAEVQLSSVIASVADMLAIAIVNAGMRISGPDADVTAVAWADPERVRQILVNLVMNAVKYGGPGGGTITLRCARSGDVVTASVSDTGPGIPPEKLDTIFEPFVQLRAGQGQRRDGVGLGLAISRDLARGMNGDLSVESPPGEGASFTLTLPRARRRLLKSERTER